METDIAWKLETWKLILRGNWKRGTWKLVLLGKWKRGNAETDRDNFF